MMPDYRYDKLKSMYEDMRQCLKELQDWAEKELAYTDATIRRMPFKQEYERAKAGFRGRKEVLEKLRDKLRTDRVQRCIDARLV